MTPISHAKDQPGHQPCFLCDLDLFTVLSDQEMSSLLKLVKEIHVPKKTDLARPDQMKNFIFIVKAGAVRLYDLSFEGKKVVVSVLGQGAIFGDLSLKGQATKFNFAQAEAGSIVGRLPRVSFFQFVKLHPDLSLRIIDELNRKLIEAQMVIKDFALAQAPERIVSALVRYAKERGLQDEKSFIIPNHITHQEIADMTGLTRETVSVLISRLRRSSLIRPFKKRGFIITKAKLASVY